jgi:D-cysteine desulfhydrase
VVVDTTPPWQDAPVPLRGMLAQTPTPLQSMDRLAAALGRPAGSLLVKRDDLTGLAGGGNKARKLEYLCADAVSRGATWLVSGGGPQSNHARMTAAAAARLGLGCTLLIQGRPDPVPSGNLLLDVLLGARIEYVPPSDFDGAEAQMAMVAARLEEAGQQPYVVATGGSTPLGALGMADSAREVLAERPDVDLLVVATGSAGTQAGLAVGMGSHARVLGFRVAMQHDLADRAASIAAGAADLAGVPAPEGEVRLDASQLGPGYGQGTEACLEALALVARTEGLVLDPVYTGKAMAGLIAAVRTGAIDPDEVVTFVHTGGMPGLLSTSQAAWAARGLGIGEEAGIPGPRGAATAAIAL